MKEKVCGWVLIVLGILFGIATLMGMTSFDKEIYLTLNMVGLILAIAHLLGGFGFLKVTEWAKGFGSVLTGILALMFVWLYFGGRAIPNESLRAVGFFISYTPPVGLAIIFVYCALFFALIKDKK